MRQRRIRRLRRTLLDRGLAPEFDPRQETAPRVRLRESRAPGLAGTSAKEAAPAATKEAQGGGTVD